jgi:hypothetical protein
MNPPPLNDDFTTSEKVRTGQRLLIFAILCYFFVIILSRVLGGSAGAIVAGLLGLTSIVLAILGVLRLSGGLGYGVGLRIVLCLLVLLPLVGLIIMLVLSSKANGYLQARGYRVGLLGAEPLR